MACTASTIIRPWHKARPSLDVDPQKVVSFHVRRLAANRRIGRHPVRIKELSQQRKTDRPKLGDMLCNRVAEATRKWFYSDNETPCTLHKESPKC